ncbi:hypothetical protein VPH35_119454 [Triticum aestivum]
MHGYSEFVQSLTGEQYVIASQTTIRETLKTPAMNVRRVLCQEIASTYDSQVDAFVIRGVPMRITLQDVEHITGLPSMGRDYVPPPFKEVQDLWLDLKDPEDNKLTLKGLRKQMIGEERPRFVKPYVLYTIGKLVCPATQPYVDPKYLGIVVDIPSINSINYAKLSLDHLMSSVRKFVNGAANLEGNLPLLQTWFYEKFRVDHIDCTISYLQRDKPLIQYWDEAKAGKVDKIISQNYVGVGQMVEDLRRPWKPVRKDHRFGIGKDFNEGQRVDNNIKKTSKNVAASTNEVPKCVYSNPSKNLAGEFEKVKKTPVDPHKGKTDRDDAVDSFGKRFRSDSKNLPSQSEKVKKTYAHPQKSKTERDDSKNLPSESEKVKPTSMDDMDSIGRRVRHDGRKKKKSSLLQSEEYEFYTPALRKKRALSQQTHDSNDVMYTQNKKMNPGKSNSQQLKQLKEDLINFQAETDRVTQNIVADYVNSTPETAKLVKIKDILLTQKYLKCLTTPDHSSFAAWVDDDVLDAAIELLRLDGLEGVRDHGTVYVERSTIVNILKRDGTVPNCTLDVLSGKSGTKWGDNYLKHDMIFLPSNIPKNHWFLAVVNSQKREIQILDSLQSRNNRKEVIAALLGMETHIDIAVMENGLQGSRWPDTQVASWPIKDYEVPQQTDGCSCALWVLKFIQYWTGVRLSAIFNQDDIR